MTEAAHAAAPAPERAPGSRAERLAGPGRAMQLCDGSPEEIAEFEWFAAMNDGGLAGDPLVAESMHAWARVVDSPRVLAWWQGTARGKPALPLAALRRQPVGVMRVLPESQHWQPAPWEGAGLPALTWCEAVGAPAQGLDLLAMDPFDRTRWRLRRGYTGMMPADADALLLHFGAEEGLRFRLYEYPLDWLAAGCPEFGLVVLDWASGAACQMARLLNEGRIAVVCDNDRHARAVKRRARPPRPKLRVTVAAELLGAAE